jgi:DNA polymerase I-like protein with 3'-5' exonuclease and polymerase domains
MTGDELTTEVEFAKYKSVMRLATFDEAVEALSSIKEAALDFETTALYPKEGKIRITSVANDEHCFLVDHEFCGPFEKLLPHMQNITWWVYNAKFEVRWCDYWAGRLGLPDLDICDVDFLAKAKIGGHPSSLAKMAARDLKIILDKELQMSDWSEPLLTDGQYDYAGFDAYVTWKLVKHWKKLVEPSHWRGFDVFNDSVRATIECEDTGMFLNTDVHCDTVAVWERKYKTFERYLRRFTPVGVIPNLNSNAQIGKFLKSELPKEVLANWPMTAKTKALQLEGSYIRSMSRQFGYPFNRWLAALAGYKYYGKYLSTYGDTLITKASLAGTITSRFNIAQAATGRFSSSTTNLQNIPRKKLVRQAFYAPEPDKQVMCLADYSGIEIRVLAELSQDKQLIHDAIYSDVHAASAAQIYGLNLDHVLEILENPEHQGYRQLKEMRTKAKGFTFQLTYGAGPSALSDVLRCSFDEAIDAINAWAARYGRAYAYRNTMFDIMKSSGGYLPICDGRTVKVFKDEQTLPVAANYPIQGAAASVMYRAMYHVHRLFKERDIPAYLCATVHDELLCYADTPYADEAMETQLEGMRLGWLDVFPGTVTDNLIEHAIGTDWSAKP